MEHTGSFLCYRLLSNKEQDLNGGRAWEKYLNLCLCALLQTEKQRSWTLQMTPLIKEERNEELV